MTTLQRGDTVIFHKSEGTHTNCGCYSRASAAVFLILNYIKNQTNLKVQKQDLCLPAQFLRDPDQ